MLLDAGEVVHIARTLALAPERFVELVEVAEGAESAVGIQLAGHGERRQMRLRRRPDGSGRTRCHFLVTSGSGRHVCGLGALAPAACKAFPAPHVTAPGTKVAHCWRTWEPHEVADVARDEAGHAAAVARWNERAAERRHAVPETALLHALLADPALTRQPEVGPADGLPEPRSQSGCATCTTSRCCVVFDPEVTGADLLRLVDGLGLEPHDIAALRPTRRDQAGPDAILLGDDCAWDLRLRRTGHASGPGGRRRCGFLVDVSHGELPAASRCGVYAYRPLVCRLFPSDLTAFGVMVGTPEAVCPPQAWSQERADLPALHTLHLAARAERERFRVLVAAWNPASFALAGRTHEARAAALFSALLAFERVVARELARGAADLAPSELAREVVAGQLSK